MAGLAPASRARRLSAIRRLFKFLVGEDIIEEDPTHGLSGPRRARALPKTLSVAEVDRLIEGARRRTQTSSGREHVRALRLYESLLERSPRVEETVTAWSRAKGRIEAELTLLGNLARAATRALEPELETAAAPTEAIGR